MEENDNLCFEKVVAFADILDGFLQAGHFSYQRTAVSLGIVETTLQFCYFFFSLT